MKDLCARSATLVGALVATLTFATLAPAEGSPIRKNIVADDRVIVGYVTHDQQDSTQGPTVSIDMDYSFEGTWEQLRTRHEDGILAGMPASGNGTAKEVRTGMTGSPPCPYTATMELLPFTGPQLWHAGVTFSRWGDYGYQLRIDPPGARWRDSYESCTGSNVEEFDQALPSWARGWAYGTRDTGFTTDENGIPQFPGFLGGAYTDMYNTAYTWEICWKPTEPRPKTDPCPEDVLEDEVSAMADGQWTGGSSALFNASGSGGPINSYDWDFGDGESGSGVSPSHVYAKAGVYDVTLTVSGTGSLDSDTFRLVVDPPRLYAPELRLHPEEEYFPADPAEFVENSGLWWAHDAGCVDHREVAAKKINVRFLVSGNYEHQNAGNVLCRDKGERYTSKQLTAPAKGGKLGLGGDRKKANGSGREGFFLDVLNGEREGNRPLDDEYSNAPPMYYDYEPGRYIIYWFFYAFSGRSGDKHEGDWERMAVRLQDNDEATTAAYWQHFCDPLDSNTSYGKYSWSQMRDNNFLVDETHPTAYSAISGHPTFPTHVGRIEAVPCDNPLNGIWDATAEGGDVWKTWEGPMYDVKHQDWYGFGGGWGAKIGGATGWGPLGPGRPMQKSSAPAQPGSW